MHRATMHLCNGPECEQTRAGNGQGNPPVVVGEDWNQPSRYAQKNQSVSLDSKGLLTDGSVPLTVSGTV